MSVLFQIAKELPNLADFRIESLGVTRDEPQRLLSALRSARRTTPPGARVGVYFDGPLVSLLGGDNDAVSAEDLLISAQRVVTTWADWLDTVIAALGDRELFLRTGYQSDEARAALARLRTLESIELC